MKLVAFYGSLKRGHYNHSALGADAEFLGEGVVRGVMYSNGSYPKLYHFAVGLGDNLDGVLVEDLERDHVLEIYKINEEAYRGIHNMELGAGYVAEEIETDWGPATIYYMPHEHFSNSDKWVESY